MKSHRTITDEMARLLSRVPVNGCSTLAWEISTVLAEYDQAMKEWDRQCAEADAVADRIEEIREEKAQEAAARFGRTKRNIERILGRRPS